MHSCSAGEVTLSFWNCFQPRENMYREPRSTKGLIQVRWCVLFCAPSSQIFVTSDSDDPDPDGVVDFFYGDPEEHRSLAALAEVRTPWGVSPIRHDSALRRLTYRRGKASRGSWRRPSGVPGDRFDVPIHLLSAHVRAMFCLRERKSTIKSEAKDVAPRLSTRTPSSRLSSMSFCGRFHCHLTSMKLKSEVYVSIASTFFLAPRVLAISVVPPPYFA